MYLKEKNLYNKCTLLQVISNKCKENNLVIIFFHLSENRKSSSKIHF